MCCERCLGPKDIDIVIYKQKFDFVHQHRAEEGSKDDPKGSLFVLV